MPYLIFRCMKIETALLMTGLIAAGLIVIVTVSSVATPVFAQQTTICHRGRTIEVSSQAVPALLSVGDFLGPCT
jgi:hypothetical protein